MKRFVLFSTFVFIVSMGFGQCPPGSISLSSQAEVDAFAFNYPTCSTISGSLFISGPDITNLTPLQNITSLGFLLEINTNPLLVSLEGLNNLESLLQLKIRNNDALIDVSALGNIDTSFLIEIVNNNVLQEIANWNSFVSADQLFIIGNDELISLAGLSSLDINDSITIEDNDSLQDLDGLQGILNLSNLNITGNAQLEDISALSNVEGNLFSTLIISLNDSLTNIDGLEGIENIQNTLWIKSNPVLQNISGLSGLSNAGYGPFLGLEIQFNDSLTDIGAIQFLDPNSIEDVNIGNNPSLSQCSILSFCLAIQNGNQDLFFYLNSTGCNSYEEVENNCDLNTVEGNIKFNFNNDNCATGDYFVNGAIVRATNTLSQSASAIANEMGFYRILLPEGTYILEVVPETLPENFNSDPNSVTIVFNATGELENVDFCVSATEELNDLKVTLFPIEDARPGFESSYQIVYENLGTTALSGEVTIQFDGIRQEFLEAMPVQDDISGSVITWNFIDLLPFESKIVDITFDNFPPPTNNSGDILNFMMSIYPVINDINPEDNTYIMEQVMVNSQDPNDKIVNQGLEIFQEEVGNYLDYAIRFQNVGSASAINVKVEDILSENLNWNSFRVLSASHEYRVEIINNSDVLFIFDNINLPPISSDPEGSKGFITFQIRTLETLTVGESVDNTASIYFDFNAPIITNTVNTIVVDNLSVAENQWDKMIRIYPNPVSDILNITVSETITFEKATVYNVLGQQLLDTSEKSIDVSAFSEGVYFVIINTDRGAITYKVVKE